MKKYLFFVLIFVLFVSCGYKVRTEIGKPLYLESFELNDAYLIEYKKDIEWKFKDILLQDGYMFSQDYSKDSPSIRVKVLSGRERTVQSGSDNRQTVKEHKYKIEVTILFKGKDYSFNDEIRVYQKFATSSNNFLDTREDFAKTLATKLAIKVNGWLMQTL